MAEEYTLRHTGQEIDDLLDNVPADSKASGIYKSSLDLSTIINEGSVTQDHLTEINSIYAAWKSGRMVYVLDEKGGYYNLGVLNMQLAEDNSKCSFVALDQDGVLCYYSCNPSSGVTGKWSVTPIGKDLFALIEHTHKASDVTEEKNKRFVTDEEKDKLSTLSTTYAKADLSNAMTVSLGQNGYAKFNNGLLIQWGTNTNTNQYRTVYFPTSFFNNEYSVVTTSQSPVNVNNVTTFTTDTYSVSSFRVVGAFLGTNGSYGYPGEPFRWFAIGRWK